MRKLLPLSFFLWMLVGSAWGQTCTTTINTFPYFENFEGPNHGWVSGGSNATWALGTPAKAVISGAASGTKAWVTNLNGNYNNDESSFVTSPCFNFTGMLAPVVEFKIWWHAETTYDGAVLQSSVNNGATWQNVGAVNSGNNWYNYSSIGASPGGQGIGWTGTTATSIPPSSNGYVTAKHVLTGLAGQPNVRLRVAFAGDFIVNTYDGVAFDDFTIYDTPANDAGISAIASPTTPVAPNASNPVQVVVKNYGTSPLTSAILGFRVGNGTVTTVPHTFTTPIPLNGTSAPISIGSHSFPAGTYTLKAWTQSPNGATDGLIFNDTLSTTIISCNAISGNLTINKNAPASATNFTSFASAISALGSCGISASVVFDVVAGTGPYNERVTIGNVPGTSATKTITFNGNGNTIIAPTNTTDALVTLDGAKYIRFNNFNITADANSASGIGVNLINGAQNNNFVGNTIALSTTSTSTAYGIRLHTGANNDNLFQDNVIKGGYYGLYSYGASGAILTGNSFINNEFRDAYYYGMYFYYNNNAVIEGNQIHRPTRTGSLTFYCLYTSSSNSLTISKNRIHTIGGSTIYGIYNASSDSPVASPTVVKNNAIYNLNNDGATYAIYNSSSDGVHYFHNTVSLDDQTNGTGLSRGFYQLTTATNIRFINNNISITNSKTGAKHAIYLGTAASTIVSNNNNLYVPSGSVGYFATDFVTLANWKTANSGIYDQNSVSDDPIYLDVTTGNLRPLTVALDNLGQTGTGVTTDILGNPRSTTTPDIGAYEFSVPANDVAVIAVTGPADGCGQTTQEVISVTIRNFGSATQTNIPVAYRVNQGAWVNASPNWTGTLAPNATATYTFATPANLSARGTYAIEGRTNLTTDTNPANDSTILTVANALMPSLPISLDFEAPLSGLAATIVTTNSNSLVTEAVAASNGTGSTKGLIMEGIDDAKWEVPVGLTNAWDNNPDFFSSIKMCVDVSAGNPDSVFMTFDLKQLFKGTHYNTNFRVTVDGQQAPVFENGMSKMTLNPPFGGYGTASAPWNQIRVDLTRFRNAGTIQIALESSVKEGYQNGNGTANLLDNIRIEQIFLMGTKENPLQSNLVVFPNPSKGQFNLKVPATTRSYTVEVTDLTGKVVKQQTVKNNSGLTSLNLENTAKGIYILKIVSDGQMATRKLIVE